MSTSRTQQHLLDDSDSDSDSDKSKSNSDNSDNKDTSKDPNSKDRSDTSSSNKNSTSSPNPGNTQSHTNQTSNLPGSNGFGMPMMPIQGLGPGCFFTNENDGRLQYTGSWVLETNDPSGLTTTTHTTVTAGSQVSFNFNGAPKANLSLLTPVHLILLSLKALASLLWESSTRVMQASPPLLRHIA